MEYEQAAQAAARLGVTVRSIQKWAKDGKIHGAQKMGRDWMIPVSAQIPTAVTTKTEIDTPLPLMSAGVGVGGCMEYIQGLSGVEKDIAMAEYCYYSGQPNESVAIVEPYLDSEDDSLRFSAAVIYGFSNLSMGHTHMVEYALRIVTNQLERMEQEEISTSVMALAVFSTAHYEVELHLPYTQKDKLAKVMRHLPMGLKMYACYLLAYKAYFEKNYERMLGMVEIAIAASPDTYTIAMTYLHVLGAVALMNLRQTEKALEHLRQAWAVGGPGEIYMPFVEHHSLLQGLVETFFKKEHPAEYKRFLPMIQSYQEGWKMMYNRNSGRYVTLDLTITEFNIAMLYNRGWHIKEIAAHVELSERTVKNYIQIIYEKLGISGKKELGQFMLQ